MARSFGGRNEVGASTAILETAGRPPSKTVKFSFRSVVKRLPAGCPRLTSELGMGAAGIAIAIGATAFASYMIWQDGQGRRQPNELAERRLFHAGEIRPLARVGVDPMPTGSIAPSLAMKRRGLSGIGEGTVEVELWAPPLHGYVLRDVFEGLALIEGPNGGIRAVKPGFILPGGNKVTAIERRDGKWVVVTTGGIISEAP